MRRTDEDDRALVEAARGGDQRARDRLVAAYLPLVYNVVGRALDGHADVDDVVQETMLRCLRALWDLRDPGRFRAWLVAIAVRQVRERHRHRGTAAPLGDRADDLADPGADFADLTVLRLELTGQRREVADATRWLDTDHRELLALWWLEAAGELSRDDLALSLGLGHEHAAVRVQRMRAQLDAARVVVRALNAAPRCAGLAQAAAGWDGRPDPLWRKRFARHTRTCGECAGAWGSLVAADRLLVGLALVPVPVALLGPVSVAAPAGTAGPAAAKPGLLLLGKPALAAVGTVVAVATATVVYAVLGGDVPPGSPPAPPAAAPATSPAAAVPPVSSAPVPSRSAARPSPSATKPPATGKPKPPAVATSARKGVSTWEFGAIPAGLKAVGASWYYNWSATDASMPGPSGVEFVPMIWGADAVTDRTLATAKAEGDVLLGFNEPDLGEQANLTVERALELWPRLEATGMRLGSPAVAWGGADAGGWLDRFMTGAKERGHRVDFIALHWYGADFSAAAVGHLRGYLAAVHERYGLPIWLTEFALIRFEGGTAYPSDAQQSAFVTGATRMLASLSYVERYAWFGLPSTRDSGTGLYRADGTLTAAGRAYRAAR
jgi:RNA polymerase sigma factor (sigma-70 family)